MATEVKRVTVYCKPDLHKALRPKSLRPLDLYPTSSVTARLEEAAKTLGRRFLISGEAASVLARPDGYAYKPLGPLGICGRTEPLEVLAVTRK